MKSAQKVTRVKLNIDLHSDNILFGLVSSEPDYKLTLSLNKKIGISLKNISPVTLPAGNKSEIAFSRFSNSEGIGDPVFTLVSNRSGNDYLLKKLMNVDFLFLVHSESDININSIAAILREINTITAVFNININSIKDKNLQYLIQ
jgi:hypothetical protein